MLEQQQIHEEGPKQYAPTTYENESKALALTPHASALVAAYIAQVEAEQQDVTRARLEQLIAAHLELDGEPEQAARSAIQQLSRPKAKLRRFCISKKYELTPTAYLENERLALEQQQALAKQQAFQQRKRTRSAKQSARPATIMALKVFGAGSLAIISTDAAVAMLHDGLISFWFAWVFFMYLGLPALFGAAVGIRVRHRPAMGTFCAVGMLAPFVSLLATLVLGNFWNWWDNLWQMVLLMLFWLPVGVVSAGLTGWGRDTLRRKRRQDAGERAVRQEA